MKFAMTQEQGPTVHILGNDAATHRALHLEPRDLQWSLIKMCRQLDKDNYPALTCGKMLRGARKNVTRKL
jgi:hypothetical protein